MKTGVVDVGGGQRGIYAAGIFDFCLENGIQFDLCIGVSAGSANVCAYMAGQEKRNFIFYSEYAFRKRYMSFGNFLFKRSLFDLDYVYGTLSNSNGENPLNYTAFRQNPAELIVVASNALTGQVHYFTKEDMKKDDYSILKASSAIPFISHPYQVNEMPYFDGALSDPVPIEKAFQMGCDRVILILSRPVAEAAVSGNDIAFADRIQKRYPRAAENLRLRASRYNASVELARKYEAENRLMIISPGDTCGVDTLTRNREALGQLYEKGLRDGAKILPFVNGGTESR